MEADTNENSIKLNFKFDDENFTASIINSPDAHGDVLIPRSYQGYVITSLGCRSFQMNKEIQSMKFTNNSELRTICKNAFFGSSITSLHLPAKLEELQKGWCIETPHLVHISISPRNKRFSYLEQKIIIEKSSNESDSTFDRLIFARRNIDSLIIPSFIKYIISHSFSECKELNEITFSEDSKLLTIEKSAFSFSSLRSFYLPDSVERLVDGWCSYTPQLEFVYISPKNKNFKYLENEHHVILSKSNPEKEVYDVITFASRKIKSVIIPSYITKIASDSFSKCIELESVEIPTDSLLVSIGNNAFLGTVISDIYIPKNVEVIGKEAFITDGAESYVEFAEDSKLVSIGHSAFMSTDIEEIYIPSSVRSIGNYVFGCCKNLFEVNFPVNSELRSIGKYTFYITSITEIVIPPLLNEIGEGVFFQCRSLKLVDFSKNTELKTISKNLLAFSTVELVLLSKNITTIEDKAFYKCLYLGDIHIPKDSELRKIGKKAFYGTQIGTFIFTPHLEEINDNWCFYIPGIYNLHVSPENKKFAFLDNKKLIVIGKSDENDDDYDSLVLVCRNITKIKIPSFIKHLCSCSLSSLELVKSIEFTDDSQLVSIGSCAFSSSFLIGKITIPFNTNIVEKGAFSHCYGLRTIEFLGENLSIRKKCFFSCSSLLMISFPNSISINFNGTKFDDVSETFSLFARANTLISQI